MTRLLLAAALVTAAGLALLVSAGSAHANFKGVNGAVAFDMWVGDSQQIGLLNPDGRRISLPRRPGLSEAVPRWSPDGTKIAYHAYPYADRSVSDVWVMDADGGHKTQLTNTPVREEVPAWTADGRIVYCGQDPATLTWGVYRINADGSDQVSLTDTPVGGFDCWPSPAPSGDKLAFTRYRDGQMHIFTMKLGGGNVRQVTSGAGTDAMSDWSPFGNKIVFVRTQPNGDMDIWMANSNGSGLRQLTNTPTSSKSFPSFSPDGTQVIYSDDPTESIRSIDLATLSERLLAAPQPPTSFALGYPSWQPLPKSGAGRTSIDTSTRTATTPALDIQWSPTDPEEIVSISWRGSGNLTNTGAAWWCGAGDNEFFGNAWSSFNDTDFAMPVGGGTTGTWTAVGDHRVVIGSAASGCFGTSGIPVSTDYTLFSGNGNADRLRVQRTFDFGTTPFNHGVRPYVPRLYPSSAFTQVLHPNASGTALVAETSADCEFGCLVTNWNGTWFAIHDPQSGQGMVVRHVTTDYPAALWVDQDGASFTTSSSVALLKPSGGFTGKLTDVQDFCFYDSSTWTPTLKPPKGC